MFEVAGKRFFETLHTVAEEKLGADHPCTRSAGCAAKSGAAVDIDHAQAQLSELSPPMIEALMEAVHKTMREDPSAMLDHWSGAAPKRRPN